MKRLNITVDFKRHKFSNRIEAQACLTRPIHYYRRPIKGTFLEDVPAHRMKGARCGSGIGYNAADAMSDALEGLRTILSFRERGNVF